MPDQDYSVSFHINSDGNISEVMANAKASTDGLKDSQKELESQQDSLKDSAEKLVAAYLSFRTLKEIADYAWAGAEAFAAMEQEETKLSSALAHHGQNAEIASKSLKSYADNLSQTTLYTKAQITSAEALAAQFGKTEPEIEAMVKGAMSLSNAIGMDLTSAMSMMVRGTEGSRNMLARWGIEVDSKADPATKLQEMLKGIHDKFGDVTDATDKDALALKNEKQAWEDLHRAIGQLVMDAPGFMSAISGITHSAEGLSIALENIKKVPAAGEHTMLFTILTGGVYGLYEAYKRLGEAADIAGSDVVKANARMSSSADSNAGALFSTATEADQKKIQDAITQGQIIAQQTREAAAKEAGDKAAAEFKRQLDDAQGFINREQVINQTEIQKDQADYDKLLALKTQYGTKVKGIDDALFQAQVKIDADKQKEADKAYEVQKRLQEKQLRDQEQWDRLMLAEAKKTEEQWHSIYTGMADTVTSTLIQAISTHESLGPALVKAMASWMGGQLVASGTEHLWDALMGEAQAVQLMATPGMQAWGAALAASSAAHAGESLAAIAAGVAMGAAGASMGGASSGGGGSSGGGSSPSGGGGHHTPHHEVVHLHIGNGRVTYQEAEEMRKQLNKLYRNNAVFEMSR